MQQQSYLESALTGKFSHLYMVLGVWVLLETEEVMEAKVC